MVAKHNLAHVCQETIYYHQMQPIIQHATLLDLGTTQLVNGCNLIKRKLVTCGFLVAAYPYKVAFGAAFL
jgi:hypothetical protein